MPRAALGPEPEPEPEDWLVQQAAGGEIAEDLPSTEQREDDDDDEEEAGRKSANYDGGRRSSTLKRASLDPEVGSPRSSESNPNPVRQSIGWRLAGGVRSIRSSIGRIDLGRLRQPVRVSTSKWQRRGRRFLTLSLAIIGYILFLLNTGSLGESLKPTLCDEDTHCVRHGSSDMCVPICKSDVHHNTTADCEPTPRFSDPGMHSHG